MAANGLTALTDNLARLAGGPMGGIILQFGGLQGVVLCDAGSFLIAALLLARGPSRAEAQAAAAGAGDPAPRGRGTTGLLGQWPAGLGLIRVAAGIPGIAAATDWPRSCRPACPTNSAVASSAPTSPSPTASRRSGCSWPACSP